MGLRADFVKGVWMSSISRGRCKRWLHNFMRRNCQVVHIISAFMLTQWNTETVWMRYSEDLRHCGAIKWLRSPWRASTMCCSTYAITTTKMMPPVRRPMVMRYNTNGGVSVRSSLVIALRTIFKVKVNKICVEVACSKFQKKNDAVSVVFIFQIFVEVTLTSCWSSLVLSTPLS